MMFIKCYMLSVTKFGRECSLHDQNNIVVRSIKADLCRIIVLQKFSRAGSFFKATFLIYMSNHNGTCCVCPIHNTSILKE